MLPLGTQRVNGQGHLEVGGCDTVELAKQFGTPLYVMDEQLIRQCCREYREAFGRYTSDSLIFYAGKAFLPMAMCRIAQQEGLGLDVASAGELYTALRAGFPPEQICLHGNFKSEQELVMALEAGVGWIVVDCEPELEQLNALAGERGIQASILIRANPDVKPKTHTSIQTGQIDSKFGLGISTSHALRAVRRALELPHLNLRGLHCHIGSQVLGIRAFEVAAEMMISFMAEVRRSTGVTLPELNLGGGLGIRYVFDDEPPSIEEYARSICRAVHQAAAAEDFPIPKIMQEPGRSIVGEAGLTLYTVGVVKEIPHVRTYVSVDGGLSDNPRPEMYGAEYVAVVANKAHQEPTQVVTIAGKHCETDTLIHETHVAPVRPGDLLAVQSTGAYNYAMSSNYNRFPRPAVVLVKDGRAEVIVKRETLEDLIAHDVLPERLNGGEGHGVMAR